MLHKKYVKWVSSGAVVVGVFSVKRLNKLDSYIYIYIVNDESIRTPINFEYSYPFLRI